MKLFTPNYYIRHFNDLNIDYLKQQGIQLLACDIDNTLAAHDELDPSDDVVRFIKNIQAHGIEVVLLSNNVKERVERFADALGLKNYPFARKPLKVTYRRLLNDSHLQKHQIAVLGDQLLTDMLGANRMGFYTILTTPVVQRDLTCTKINRVFEHAVFKVLEWKGSLKRGEYDE